YEIEETYITDNAYKKFMGKADEILDSSNRIYMITEDIAEKLSDTVNPQGIFCVVKIKAMKSEALIENSKKYVALQNVQDPSNLGAIARTAEALGIAGIIIEGGCDIYNPKALRASMGSLLRINLIETKNLQNTIDLAGQNMVIFVTVPDDSASKITEIDMSGGVIAIIGNEGNGISQELINAIPNRVTIPMRGNAESLNASAAAIITMWEMMR
ncbi:MAG: RNA methyltransferase, partial [Oscillospiraceae bacterium]